MRYAIKAVLNWIASGLWWILDHLYGERIYAQVRPMMPEQLLSPSFDFWVPLTVGFGPPALLACLGAYFFYKALAKERGTAPPIGASAPLLEPAPSPRFGDSPKITQGPGSALSIGQIGGLTAGTVNIGKKPRRLNDGLRSQILKDCPRDAAWNVAYQLGDGEAGALAHEVYSFMRASGFKMDAGTTQQRVFDRPAHGLMIMPEPPKKWVFIVGYDQ